MAISTPEVRDWLYALRSGSEVQLPDFVETHSHREKEERDRKRVRRRQAGRRLGVDMLQQGCTSAQQKELMIHPSASPESEADTDAMSSFGCGMSSSDEECSAVYVYRKKTYEGRRVSTCSTSPASTSLDVSQAASEQTSAVTTRHSSITMSQALTSSTPSYTQGSLPINFDTCGAHHDAESESNDGARSFESLPAFSSKSSSKSHTDVRPVGGPPSASLQSWESMRIHFSSEVLNRVAHFYNDIESDEVGCRTIHFEDLKTAAYDILNVPAQSILNELQHRGLNVVVIGGSITLNSLLELLQLMHAARLDAIQKSPQAICSAQEVDLFEQVFNRHVNRSGCVSVANLFTVITEMGIEELDMTSPRQQQLMAAFLRDMQDALPPGSRRKASQSRALTFREVMQLIVVGLNHHQCKLRSEDLSREQSLRAELCFSVVEFDEIRELYRSFLTYLEQEKKDNMTTQQHIETQLVALLAHCGVAAFSASQAQALRTLLREKSPSSDGQVRLDSFAFWMDGIFKQHLGGLDRKDRSIQTQLEDKGFMATLARECQAANLSSSPVEGILGGDQQVTSTSADPHGCMEDGASSSSHMRSMHKRRTLTVDSGKISS
jgi:hypothetical protein